MSEGTPVFSRPIVAVAEPDPAPAPAPDESIIGKRAQPLPHDLAKMQVTVVAALRMEGYSHRKIARALTISEETVRWCLREARKRGELRDGVAEAIELLDNDAVPLAVDAVMRKLRKGEDKAVFGILEGRGLLRSFKQVNQDGGNAKGNMAFQFVFTGAPGGNQSIGALPDVRSLGLPGDIVGAEASDDED